VASVGRRENVFVVKGLILGHFSQPATTTMEPPNLDLDTRIARPWWPYVVHHIMLVLEMKRKAGVTPRVMETTTILKLPKIGHSLP